MNPIINPMWFYLADIVGEIDGVAKIGGACCCGALLIMVLLMPLILDCCGDEGENAFKKWLKGIFVAAIVLGVMCGLIPSEKTVYTMMTVEQLTPNNIDAAGNTAKDAIDYIFEKIDELDKEEE